MLSVLVALGPTTATLAETTENLVDSDWDTTGQVQTGDDYVRFTYTQGVARQTIDLSEYDNIEQLTYGADFLGCNNFIGGHCGSTNSTYYDQVVVKLYVGSAVYEQTVTTDYNQGWISQEWTVDLAESPASAILQFSGYDPGYWAGWYGPIVRDPYLQATYSWAVLEPIVNPTTPVVEETTASDLVADGILTDIITAPVAVDAGIAEIQADIAPVTPDLPVAQDMGMTDTIEGPAAQEMAEAVDEPAQPEPAAQQKVAEVKAEGGKVSAKAVAAQLGGAYNPAAQGVMMALMQAPQIKQPSLVDTLRLVDKGLSDKPMADRFWLGSLASDAKWQRMVESQWQK